MSITKTNKKCFVSYLDDNDEKVEGFFEVIETAMSYVKIRSGKNDLTIPFHRIKKIKEEVRNEQ